MIKVGIIGATGYTGVELLRLLAPRQDMRLVAVTSREWAGRPVWERFPNLRGHLDLAYSSPDAGVLGQCDVVFFATPHGVAMEAAPALLANGTRVIDLSADFRIKDASRWEAWYGMAHTAREWLAEAVYGLPEFHREAIRGARLVAAPGCYPTAIQLGLIPLLEARLVEPRQLIADAKSGVSGAGRKAVEDYLLCEATESMRAYAVAGHRHHPEISEQLDRVGGEPASLTFIPHLAPMARGILATMYARAEAGAIASSEWLREFYARRYAGEPFVTVLPTDSYPATRDVRGSNRCALGLRYLDATGMVVVIAAEDNLVKGAAGQAIQCMNIMLGCAETAGLDNIALLP